LRFTPAAAPVSGGGAPAGRKLPITSASVRVDGVEKPLPVGDDDEVITMQFELTAGPIKVEAEFLDEQGFTRGAYFLEIAKTGTLREPVRLHE